LLQGRIICIAIQRETNATTMFLLPQDHRTMSAT